MESLAHYISHPEKLNRETLYELRMLVAKYPYFDAARLLMLKNLYLLHDIEFGREMRKAALYLKNRRVLFDIMEGYGAAPLPDEAKEENPTVDRTMSLIDAFLETLPAEKLSLEAEGAAAVDYLSAYLKDTNNNAAESQPVPELRGQSLIDDFLSGNNERITLQLEPEEPTLPDSRKEEEEEIAEEAFFTETLANIYIKQQKYEKALEIIKRLCLEYPNKNRYFADQMRFLEKLVKYSKRN